EGLIPANPPKEAIETSRKQANAATRGDHYHAVANPAKGEPAGERALPNKGYRPGRKAGEKREREGGHSERRQDSPSASKFFPSPVSERVRLVRCIPTRRGTGLRR